jgi:hypothetical protein
MEVTPRSLGGGSAAEERGDLLEGHLLVEAEPDHLLVVRRKALDALPHDLRYFPAVPLVFFAVVRDHLGQRDAGLRVRNVEGDQGAGVPLDERDGRRLAVVLRQSRARNDAVLAGQPLHLGLGAAEIRIEADAPGDVETADRPDDPDNRFLHQVGGVGRRKTPRDLAGLLPQQPLDAADELAERFPVPGLRQ